MTYVEFCNLFIDVYQDQRVLNTCKEIYSSQVKYYIINTVTFSRILNESDEGANINTENNKLYTWYQ